MRPLVFDISARRRPCAQVQHPTVSSYNVIDAQENCHYKNTLPV